MGLVYHDLGGPVNGLDGYLKSRPVGRMCDVFELFSMPVGRGCDVCYVLERILANSRRRFAVVVNFFFFQKKEGKISNNSSHARPTVVQIRYKNT